MAITPEEAYKILTKDAPLQWVSGCLDFGTFYVFGLIPLFQNKKDTYLSGPIFDAVDKKTGKVFEYNITSDPDAYYNAKEIEIKTPFDAKISELMGGEN